MTGLLCSAWVVMVTGLELVFPANRAASSHTRGDNIQASPLLCGYLYHTCWGTGRARAGRLWARVWAHDVRLPDRSDGGRTAVRRERFRDALPVEGVLAVARGACGSQRRSQPHWRSSCLPTQSHPEAGARADETEREAVHATLITAANEHSTQC